MAGRARTTRIPAERLPTQPPVDAEHPNYLTSPRIVQRSAATDAVLLVTVAGRDRPGVLATIFDALAGCDAQVRDVEQVVIRDRLVLSILIDARARGPDVKAALRAVTSPLGLDCEVGVAAQLPTHGGRRAGRHHVIVIGHPLRAAALAEVAAALAGCGANVESISRLAAEPVSSLELIVRAPDPVALRACLLGSGAPQGVDIAIEPAGLRRRAKRLVVLDVDSTLIQDEAIDVLAERAGVGAQVAAITELAMAGDLDFEGSLRARVRLLAGLPADQLPSVAASLRLTPGARTFVRTLRRIGCYVGVVSGGFTFVTDRFRNELGLDFAAANELEVVHGALTGDLVGPVVDRAGKAAALASFAAGYGVPLSQTVAVGDGSNDIDMLEAAGLGIAFNGRASLRAAADASVNVPYLDSVLFVLGISADEVQEAADGTDALDDVANATA